MLKDNIIKSLKETIELVEKGDVTQVFIVGICDNGEISASFNGSINNFIIAANNIVKHKVNESQNNKQTIN